MNVSYAHLSLSANWVNTHDNLYLVYSVDGDNTKLVCLAWEHSISAALLLVFFVRTVVHKFSSVIDQYTSNKKSLTDVFEFCILVGLMDSLFIQTWTFFLLKSVEYFTFEQ